MLNSGHTSQRQESEPELEGLINNAETGNVEESSCSSTEVLMGLSADDNAPSIVLEGNTRTEGSTDTTMAECRICQDEDYIFNMIAPCACAGTVEWVHHECVQKWVTEKGDLKCEICGSDFKGSFTVPDRSEEDARLQRALAALGHRLFLREAALISEASEVEAEDRALYNQATATGRRLSVTYCFSFILLMLGMVLMHHTFSIIDQDTQSTVNSLHNETYPESVEYMHSPAVGGNGPYTTETDMDWGIVSLWLFLRLFVVFLPLLVMLRVVSAMREARESHEAQLEAEQVVAIELQNLDIESLFQRIEASRAGHSATGVSSPMHARVLGHQA